MQVMALECCGNNGPLHQRPGLASLFFHRLYVTLGTLLTSLDLSILVVK